MRLENFFGKPTKVINPLSATKSTTKGKKGGAAEKTKTDKKKKL